jgi:CheY-like chemotaxis protein
MLKMLQRLIGEHIALVWRPDPNLEPVKVDPAQVDQMLVNLCVNARDAISDVGKITMETRNVTLDEAACADSLDHRPGDFVMLTVSDDGCGMDDETMQRIFEPFYTTKGVGEGTGLGLATVYGSVKQNHGFVRVSSAVGKGTTFRIYLPRYAGELEEAREAKPVLRPRGRGERVLLVEDEPAILRVGREMLEQLGYTVLTADTPGLALRLADAHRGGIDLLITDVVLPEMNGRQLLDEIRSREHDLKCLFVSGYTANVFGERGVLDEGFHFLQKPFTVSELAQSVRRALEDR